MRAKIGVRGRLLLEPGTRHAGASSESGRALSRTTLAGSRDGVNERFWDDDSNTRRNLNIRWYHVDAFEPGTAVISLVLGATSSNDPECKWAVGRGVPKLVPP